MIEITKQLRNDSGNGKTFKAVYIGDRNIMIVDAKVCTCNSTCGLFLTKDNNGTQSDCTPSRLYTLEEFKNMR